MKENKVGFTPGPWVASGTNIYKEGVTARIKLLSLPPTPYNENAANARLIAAAPELLDIAKAYRNLLRTMAATEGEVATFAHIEYVLAKAEGRE